jgi:hypothetical protein
MTTASVESALKVAADLDLSDVEAQFAASLPDVPAREAMEHETSLEYRRLHALRALGSSAAPEAGTLLDRFLRYVPAEKAQEEGSGVEYQDVFDHATPYPWSVEIAGLCHAGPAPSSGAGSDNTAL